MTVKTFAFTTLFVLATASIGSAHTSSTNETLDYQVAPTIAVALTHTSGIQPITQATVLLAIAQKGAGRTSGIRRT